MGQPDDGHLNDDLARMRAADDVAREMGMAVTRADTNGSEVTMTVTPSMTNGFDVGHGGLIFTLADTAMAYASNASGGTTLATTASIEWLTAVRAGDHLVAVCRGVARRGRNSIWDVDVTRSDGTQVALFRGQTLTLGESAGA